MSDIDVIESNCDEENEEWTWYPSESVLEEWNQGKDIRNEHKKSLKEGHCLPQLVNVCFVYEFCFDCFVFVQKLCPVILLSEVSSL